MSVGNIAFIAGFMFGAAFGFLICAVMDPGEIDTPSYVDGESDDAEGE